MRPDELLAEVHQHHPRLNRHILDFVSRRGKAGAYQVLFLGISLWP